MRRTARPFSRTTTRVAMAATGSSRASISTGPKHGRCTQVLRARKPWLDPTLAVFERRADRPPSDVKRELVPVLVAGFAKMKQLTKRASAEGARVVLGGHSAVPFAARGEAPWRELELLVESGLSPLEAITAATGTACGISISRQRVRPPSVGVEGRPGGPRRRSVARHLCDSHGPARDGRGAVGRRGALSEVLRRAHLLLQARARKPIDSAV